MRKLYDRVKNSILDTTIVRKDVSYNSATEQYYKDLMELLHIDDFPMILINTIEKKTYIVESNKKYFLVFDYYLMEIMDFFNQHIFGNDFSNSLEPFFLKILSEELYTKNNIPVAMEFAGKYMERREDVDKSCKEKNYVEITKEYLFIQQAFLIAHEFFHFYIHKNPAKETQGLLSKKRFLKGIYNYVNEREPEMAYLMMDIIEDKNVIEECLCDATAVMQAINVGLKHGRLDSIELGVAAAVALMNQFTISIIQDTVKFDGDISYDRIQNLFNFRLLHLKVFSSLYIKELGSEDEQKKYLIRVEDIYSQWMKSVCSPIIYMLRDCINLLKYKSSQYTDDSEELKSARRILKYIFKS